MTMKAAIVQQGQPPVYGDHPDPATDRDLTVVQLCAAALTNLDIAIASGRHYFSSATYPVILGKECVATTSGGGRFFFNVKAIPHPYGSMAQSIPVHLAYGLPVPDGVPDVLAAALGNAGLAAWLPLSWRGRLRAGETVLILGATGTCGLIAVAAAKLLGAGRVIAAGRDREALAEATRLGADAHVELDGFKDLPAAFSHAAPDGVDVVIDYLNGPVAEAALGVMAEGGRMVQVGSAAGPTTTLPAQVMRRGGLDVLGFAYYHAPLAQQAAAYTALCRHAVKGALTIHTTTMPLHAVAEAWAQQKAEPKTRVVLVPD
jgi:NADPH:quinone reductase-like Zn-dependent oxidoreductase